MDVIRSFPDTSYLDGAGGLTRAVADLIEAGEILHSVGMEFALDADERRFLDPRWSDGKAKNITGGRFHAWHDLGCLQRSGPARGDERAVQDGADLLSRRGCREAAADRATRGTAAADQAFACMK